MDILVVGIGGCGQTYFMKYLQEKSFKLNHWDDLDGLKHISCPSKLSVKQKKCKIIYVYNNSFNAICSHYRRNWPIIQMKKIKINNTCQITKVEDFFKLIESSLFDHFGCKDYFLRWYKYDFQNRIYFLNLSKINRNELSDYLECDKSIFNDLIYDPTIRKNYNYLKSNYPLSNILYTNIDNYINDLSVYRNGNSIKFIRQKKFNLY